MPKNFFYIENIAFFIGILPTNKADFTSSSLLFQNQDSPYKEYIDDKKFLNEILKNLQNTQSLQELKVQKLELFYSVFGTANLRIYCSSDHQIDPDIFSFDKVYIQNTTVTVNEYLYELLAKYFLKKFEDNYDALYLKSTSSLKFDEKYLYHQHVSYFSKNKTEETNPVIKWSIYEYNNISNMEDEKVKTYLELDSFLLEKNLLFYTFTRCYIQILGKDDSNLKTYQYLINTNRKITTQHELLLHEFQGQFFEVMINLFDIHRVKQTEKVYRQIENNFEHYIVQLQDARRHYETIILQYIFLFLAFIGLISILTGILALLPDKDKVCEDSTPDNFLINSYDFLIENGFIIFASITVIIILITLFAFIKKKDAQESRILRHLKRTL